MGRSRTMTLALALMVPAALPAHAQTAAQTTVLVRTATGRGTYHYAEVYHERGKLVLPDIGYIDFDEPSSYRELFIGGGGVVFSRARTTVVAEAFLDKAFGSRSGGALYLLPWVMVLYRAAPRLAGEVVYFPYIPLSDAGRGQHVLERAKLEYDFPRLKIGAGYGAYKFGADAVHHKPFATATFKAGRTGAFELWMQRLPGNRLTVQIRYANVFR